MSYSSALMQSGLGIESHTGAEKNGANAWPVEAYSSLRIERDCGQDDQILLVTENPLHNITTAATLRDQHRAEIT